MDMEDTIAAISTAMGESSIGIVRMSGPDALDIADKIFYSEKKPQKWVPFRMHYGFIQDPSDGTVIDEVLLCVMISPKSYTRENMVEIHTHGGYVSLRKVLQLVLHEGARLAEPGEFTKRAFMNGRIALSQAEAVIDIIRAKTDVSLNLAVRQLKGRLSEKIHQVLDSLMNLAAFLEVSIDYPEDDLEIAESEGIEDHIIDAKRILDDLIESSKSGRILREGLKTVIIGKPNVGKSSLLNALIKENKAIVTAIPGTTRDIVEETIDLNGIPLQILDTAGIRDTDDIVEKIGVERAVAHAQDADLILLVLDDADGITETDTRIMELLQGKNVVVLINKTDLSKNRIDEHTIALIADNFRRIIRISVKEGTGLDILEKEIREMVYSGDLRSDESFMITNLRHVQLLKQASSNLAESLKAIQERIPLDMISIDIRNAMQNLGEIDGTKVSEDLLDTIFSKFCVGK